MDPDEYEDQDDYGYEEPDIDYGDEDDGEDREDPF